jgi:hypothetical protein
VDYRHRLVEGGECRRKGCTGVSLDDNRIWLRFFQYPFKAFKDTGCDMGERLPRPDEIQIVFRLDSEQRVELVEHVAVLRRNANNRSELRVSFKR